ncbi:MAG: hypothetical protein IT369_06220, partial [Candidatus Latescibacteria bacterium]|nr:hypothetical protein [Candidatus Latescibacterota bacterium]
MRAITRIEAKMGVLGLVLLSLLWWSGCGEERHNTAPPSGPAATDTVKVHEDTLWANPGAGQFLHAKAIRETYKGSTDFCQRCHGDDYAGGTSKVSCLECHTAPVNGVWGLVKGVFHPAGWADSLHAQEIKVNYQGSTASCLGCHGADYTGGISGVSCFKCHADPAKGAIHPAGWAEVATGRFLHAEELRKSGGNTIACQSCHGADYTGGSAGVSCLSCHTDPAKGTIHPAGWADAATSQFLHAAALRQNGNNTSSCQGCHGADYAGGSAGVSCLACHSNPAKADWGLVAGVSKHPVGWADVATGRFLHAEELRKIGDNTSSCQSCHGADYSGGIAKASCLTCHSDPGNGIWMLNRGVFHPVGWGDLATGQFLHAEELRKVGDNTSSCQSCHGADYSGGIAKVSCFRCHSEPGKADWTLVSGVYQHPAGWGDLATGKFLHAEALAQNQVSITNCQSCHGADYSGGIAEVSCLKCHTDPAKGTIHPAGWADLASNQFLHAAEIEKNNGDTSNCQSCHGADYSGGVAEVSCLKCHSDPAKGTIHPAGWADLATSQFLHAAELRKNQNNTAGCQSCHGADYSGGVAEVSCAKCHTNPAAGSWRLVSGVFVHPTGWADLGTGQFLHAVELKKNQDDTSSCQNCHGADYSGGIAGVSCLSCHTDPAKGTIHPAGWADLATNQFLHAVEIEKNKGDTSSCQSCHGADYSGGITGISCLKCHSDPAKGTSHPAGWADLATSQFLHAAEIEKNNGNTSSCQSCHGADYLGGIAGVSCLKCHTDPAKGTIHPAGWADASTGQFLHAEELKKNQDNTSACQSCHGADYRGGIAEVSCAKCHTDPAAGAWGLVSGAFQHPAGWAELATGQFLHAEELRKNQNNTSSCQSCHGADYTGGIAQASCLKCHSNPATGAIHPSGWAEVSTGQFLHAAALEQNGGNTSSCQSCHGADYAGGFTKVSCLQCHSDAAKGEIHPAGWASLSTGQFLHAAALKQNGDDTSSCQSCHGADYAGGSAKVSCLTCHTNAATGAIHPSGWANTATSQFLHATELRQNQNNTSSCQSCHGADYSGGAVG